MITKDRTTEADIEKHLREQVYKVLGGKAYKFISPGNNGVPDRLVALPGGRAVFIELKAPGKKPTAPQTARADELTALGFEVIRCMDSKAKVDAFIRVEKILAAERSCGFSE
jgi:hypothetical protein